MSGLSSNHSNSQKNSARFWGCDKVSLQVTVRKYSHVEKIIEAESNIILNMHKKNYVIFVLFWATNNNANSKEYKKGDGRKVPLDINLLEKIIQEHGVWNLCKTFVFLHASHQY